MPTGEYDINAKQPEERKHFDRSFVQCAFAIFLFIFLCVILLIISFAVRWRTSNNSVITDIPTTTTVYSAERSGKIKLSTLKPTKIEDEGMVKNESTTDSPKVIPPVTTTTAKTTTERKRIPLIEESSTLSHMMPDEVSTTEKRTEPFPVPFGEDSTTEIEEPFMTESSVMPREGSTTKEPTTKTKTEGPSRLTTILYGLFPVENTTDVLSTEMTEKEPGPTIPDTTVKTLTEVGTRSSSEMTEKEPGSTVPDTTIKTLTEVGTHSSSESTEKEPGTTVPDTTIKTLTEVGTRSSSEMTEKEPGSTVPDTTIKTLTEVGTRSSSETTEKEPVSTLPDTTVKTLTEVGTHSSSEMTEKEPGSTIPDTTVKTLTEMGTHSSSETTEKEPGSTIPDTTVKTLTEMGTRSSSETTEKEPGSTIPDTTVKTLTEVGTRSSSETTEKEPGSTLPDTTVKTLTEVGTHSSSETTVKEPGSTVPDTTVKTLTEVGSSSTTTTTLPGITTDFHEASSTEATTMANNTSTVMHTTLLEATYTSLLDDISSSKPPESTTAISSMEKIAKLTLEPDVCNTPTCKNFASRMLAQMGHEYDPCDNFYMYACGQLHKDPFMLEVDYTRDIRNRIRKSIEKEGGSEPDAFLKFSTFYKSCYEGSEEENFAEEIVTLMEGIGQFNISAKPKDLDFTAFFMGIIKLHRPLLFDIIVDVNEMDNSKYILKLTSPVHENPFLIGDDTPENCIKDSGKYPDLNKFYGDYIKCKSEGMSEEIFEQSNATLTMLNLTEHDQKLILFYMEDWIMKFSKIEPLEPKRRSDVINKKYELVKVSDLNDKYPVIKWGKLLEGLLGEEIPNDTLVQLYADTYFSKVFNLMENEDNQVQIYNGLLAAFLQQLYRDLVKTNHDKEYCLIVASRLMEDVAGAAYLQTFEKEELESRRIIINSIFEDLRGILGQQLLSSSWLGTDDLISGLSKMTVADDGGVGVYGNFDFINSNMEKVDLEEKNYVKNAINLLRRYQNIIYRSYKENPQDSTNIWTHFSLPQDIHAAFIFGLNKLVVPYGMLTTPFFHKDYPKYLLVAGLGHIIAHEMAHHFDSVGMLKRTLEGTEHRLSSTARTVYEQMNTCFTEKLEAPQTQIEDGKLLRFKLDPELFRDEQLADDIATSLVYKLFKNMSYDTTEQLPFLGMDNKKAFFLHLAQGFCTKETLQSSAISIFEDTHLPSLLRVNHLVSQSHDFSEAFGCLAKSKMNPEDRCQEFPALKIEKLKTTEMPYFPPTA